MTDPRSWPHLHPQLIAHDIGGSRDRSTAVVGGFCGYAQGKLGITEFNELPQGLYGSDRAIALAQIDARYDRNGLIVATDMHVEALEPEMREGGVVYKCLPGQHDDLGAHPVVEMRVTSRPIQHGAGDGHKRGAPPDHPQSRFCSLANRCAGPPRSGREQLVQTFGPPLIVVAPFLRGRPRPLEFC